MVSGVNLMGAKPPVMIVATIKMASAIAMIIVITGQNVGRVFMTSSLVGSGLRRLLIVSLILPKRRLLLSAAGLSGGVLGGVITGAMLSSWPIGL